MNKYSLVVGRFQPFHDGHKSMIDSLIAEGRKVCIAIMDTEVDERNPYTLDQRLRMIKENYNGDVEVVDIPPIDEVCYGRNAGFHVRRIHHDGEDVSAAEIRDGVPQVKPEKEPGFLQEYRKVAEKVHEIAEEQGFAYKSRNIAEVIAHAHSELSEAFECLRLHDEADKDIKDMTGVEVQLADVLGILMGMEISYGLKISEALLKKMEFNKTRGYLHGKKF